jgi:transposase
MGKWSQFERELLLRNKFVSKITDTNIAYTSEFKVLAVKEYRSGKSPQQIFKDSGFDLTFFDKEYAKKAIYRWCKIIDKDGSKGFKVEKRGKSATGRPKKNYDPKDLESVLKRLAYLEVENDLLKKLRALEEESLKKKGSR